MGSWFQVSADGEFKRSWSKNYETAKLRNSAWAGNHFSIAVLRQPAVNALAGENSLPAPQRPRECVSAARAPPKINARAQVERKRHPNQGHSDRRSRRMQKLKDEQGTADHSGHVKN